MKQILIIHGGTSFNTYQSYMKYLNDKSVTYDKILYHQGWKEWLAHEMPDTDVLLPSMPNPLNAVYDEWVVYFEKIMPLLSDDVRLVGHSLGAMFLAKYLDSHTLTHPVRQLILISGGYDDESSEELGSFKVLSAKNVIRSAQDIHLFHSEDDPVVPFSELAKFQRDIPSAKLHIFTDKGHFFAASPTFPELLELLQQK